jgi:hypothetical protein
VEIMGDNAVPEAGQVYGALDMPFATLMGQVAARFEKRPAHSMSSSLEAA